MSHTALGYRHSKDIQTGEDKSESCGQLVYLSDLGNRAPLNRMWCYQLVSLEHRPPQKGEKHGGQIMTGGHPDKPRSQGSRD